MLAIAFAGTVDKEEYKQKKLFFPSERSYTFNAATMHSNTIKLPSLVQFFFRNLCK